MIKHIVMWKVHGSTAEEKSEGVRCIRAAFDGLVGVIPGLLALEIGADVSRIDYAFDVVLYTEFESREALDAYSTHPAHLKVKRKLAGVRIARHQMDYVVD
ncbi:Dabb family protein [Cupriavidus basilensis]